MSDGYKAIPLIMLDVLDRPVQVGQVNVYSSGYIDGNITRTETLAHLRDSEFGDFTISPGWVVPTDEPNQEGVGESSPPLTGVTTGKTAKDGEDPNVHHPAHYNKHPSGVECIDVVRHFPFNLGNTVKYIWRAGLKGDGVTIQDLEKATFYLQDEIARRKAEESNGTSS